MAYIVITSDADFINVEFNEAANEWDKAKIRRAEARSVCLIKGDRGVEVIWSNGGVFLLHYSYVDSIDEVEITSNTVLFTELKKIM